MARHIAFVLALWKTNLLSAMEYRVSFLTQMAGMMLNNAIYFVFWIIFFARFEEVNGWDLVDMLFLFGVVATGFGVGTYLFGNAVRLSLLIASGQMDYYLSLPRPVLLHALASRSNASSAGDCAYGLLSFGAAVYFAGAFDILMLLRFGLGCLAAVTVLISFLVLVQSLTFWIGNTNLLTSNAFNAIVTFSLYPITLFDGTAKLLLFTLIPAAFIGALPAEFVRRFDLAQLAQICAGSAIFLFLATFVFYRGLRRYESGSAFQVRT